MNASHPVRRAGIAGITAALLASSALSVGLSAQPGVAWADEAPAAEQAAVPPTSQTAPVTVNGTPLYATEAPAEQGVSVTLGIPGSYDATGAQALLTRINDIRAEAAAEGIAVDGVPVSGAPLQWSTTLENVAQTRAAEASLSFAHERPNGLGMVVTTAGNTFGTQILAENLALNTNATAALDAWYAEKDAYLSYLSTGEQAGEFEHYVALISDAYATVGLGAFTASAPADASYTVPGTVLAAEFGPTSDATPSEGTPAPIARPDGACIQQVNVKVADYLSATISGEPSLQAGGTTQLSVSIASGANALGGTNLIAGTVTSLVANPAWATDNEAVATVDAIGLVSGVAAGTAYVSVSSNGTTLATLPLSVEAAPVTITGVTSPAEIVTEAGAAPALPDTLTATMSDGSTTEVPVSWDAIDPSLYSGRAGGAFDVYGTAGGFPVTAHVVVNAATPTGATLAVPGVEVQAGNAPELPATATVTWSNGETSEEPLAWDALDTNAYPEGGTVELIGYVGETGLTVTCTVTITAPAPTLVIVPDVNGWDATAASEALASAGLVANVVVGDPALNAEQVGVVYQVDPTAGAEVELGSTVTLVAYGEYVPPAPTTAIVPDVTGWDATSASEAMASAGLVASVITGDPAPSAEQVGIVYLVDPAVGTEVELGGTVTLTAYGEYEAPKPTPESVSAPKDVTITAGETPKLPETTVVTWSDGSTTEEAVSWEKIDASRYEQPGTITLNGTVGNTDLTVKINVIVEPAPEPEPITIAEVKPLPDVTTLSGVAPKLPESAQATMSDGSSAELPITWERVDPALYSGREASSFKVAGTVADEQGATMNVTVGVTVEGASVESVANIPDVTTQQGVEPELPAGVKVTWSNGDITDETIEWDGASPLAYDEVGTYTVTGSIPTTGSEVTCEVTVVAASITGQADAVEVTTPSGTAPDLPSRIKMTLDTGDTRAVDVTWKMPDKQAYSARNGGTLEVEGTVEDWNGIVVAHVTVTPAAIASASVLDSVTTQAGTAPELPETASVMWSNGDTSNEPVAWDEIDPEQYLESGTFEVSGVVAPDRADKRTVTCSVTVESAFITSVDSPAGITTPAGTAPTLPEKLTAQMSNGTQEDVPVTWDAVEEQDYSVREGGTFEVSGSIEGWNHPVSIKVTVSPATISGVEAPAPATVKQGAAPELPKTVKATWSNGDVTDEAVAWGAPAEGAYEKPGAVELSGTVEGWAEPVKLSVTVEPLVATGVEQPAGVTTQAGTAPELPKTAKVSWDNGTTTDEEIVWDEIDPEQYLEGGTFEATGTVRVSETDALEVSCAVTVEAAFITAVAAPAAVTTPSGTAPKLPETVKATMSNGTEKDVPVTWEEIKDASWQAHNGGTFAVKGEVEGWKDPVELSITVSPATISGVEAPAPATVKQGAAPELPKTVKATWSNGDVTDEAVAWGAPAEGAYEKPGAVELSGTVEGWAEPVKLSVTVEPLVATGVEQPAGVTTQAGTAPELPKTAKVSWDNGTTTDEEIAWDAIDEASYHNGGTFSVGGTIEGVEQPVTITVTVSPATATSAETPAIETPAGIAPTLPQTVRVTWSNGDITDEAASWFAIDAASYANAGATFTVEGSFSNTAISFRASAKVTVGAAGITGIDIVPAVSTVAGIAPKLPQTVTVTMSDGSRTSVPVTWNTVDASLYGTRGTFEATGRVEGFDGEARVTVKVASPTVQTVQQQVAVRTTVGVQPELPVQFTWSDGSKTAETVNWDKIDTSLYQKEGTFQVKGIANGWGVTATVTVDPAAVPKTGDETASSNALIVAGTVGTMAVIGSVILLVRKLLARTTQR